MTIKQTDNLENLRQKRDKLNAKITAEENKLRTRKKKERAALLWLWGEVVEEALKGGTLDSAEWQKQCKQYLAAGRKRELALKGIVSLLDESAMS